MQLSFFDTPRLVPSTATARARRPTRADILLLHVMNCARASEAEFANNEMPALILLRRNIHRDAGP